MRQALRLLTAFVALLSTEAFSQTPVQVMPQLLPPYSLQVSEYYSGTQPKLQVLLLNRDINQPTIQVKLRLTVESQNCRLRTKEAAQTPSFTLTSGVPYYLSPQDLQAFFSAANLDFTGGFTEQQYNETGRFPEGLYSFYVEAFELYSGNLVSNKGFALGWLTLADPPILNTPSKAESVSPAAPQNIIFNWTPRHNTSPTAAYYTDYVFTLVEYNDQSLGPDASFTSSPPFFIDSLQTTTYLYGPEKPQLVPGKRYAWRVQAKAKNGGLSPGGGVGGGLAMFRNNGFSEIYWFTYQNNCIAPLGISATVQGQRVIIEWQNNPQHLEWKVEYREKNLQDAEWFSLTNTLPRVMLTDLKPGTQYEYRVGGACLAGQFTYGSLMGFATNGINTSNMPSCGDSTLPLPGGGQPLQTLAAGNVIKAGSFDVNVGYTTGTGNFTGTGYVVVPWLANAKVEVRFTNITLSQDHKLLSGVIETTYDPTESGIDDLDEYVDIFTAGYGVGDVVTGTGTADTTVNFTIQMPGGIVVQLPAGYDATTGTGNGPVTIVLQPQGGGAPVSYTVDKLPTTILDASGNLYQVDKQGAVALLGQQGGKGLLQTTNTKHLDSDKGTVKFVDYPGKQVYAFDERRPVYKKSNAFNNEYERLNDDYYVNQKAIAPGKTDYLKAVVRLSDNSLVADSIQFVSGNGTIYTRTRLSDSTYEIAVVGGPERDAQELYALYRQGGGKTLNLGKVKVSSYPEQRFVVNLVPVNTGQFNLNAQAIADSINKVYKGLNVSFDVKQLNNLSDVSWDGNNNGLDVKGSGFFSDLTAEMRSLNALFRKKVKVNPDEVYLFLLNQASDTLVLGDMPRGRQFGYVFLQGNNVVERVIGHELGHGKFALKHLSEYGITDPQLNNVMAYPPGSQFNKHQWDLINDPSIVVAAFNKDESNLYEEQLQVEKEEIIAAFNADNTEAPATEDPSYYYFFDGRGKKYKILRSKIGNCNIDYYGVLKSFSYNGKQYVYCKAVKDGSFSGYFENACVEAVGVKDPNIAGRFDVDKAMTAGCLLSCQSNADFTQLPDESLDNVKRFNEFLRGHKSDLLNNTEQIRTEIKQILQQLPAMAVWYKDLDASYFKTDLQKFLEKLRELVKTLSKDKEELTVLINEYYVELKKNAEFTSFDPTNPDFSSTQAEKIRNLSELNSKRCAISQFFQNRVSIPLVGHASYNTVCRGGAVLLQSLTQTQRLQILNIFYQSPELTSSSWGTTGPGCLWANFGEEIVIGVLRYAGTQDKTGILNLLRQNKGVLPYFYKKIDNKFAGCLGGDDNFDHFVKELVVLSQINAAVDLNSSAQKVVTWNPDLGTTEFDVYDGVRFDDKGNMQFYRVKADVPSLVVGTILPLALARNDDAVSTDYYGDATDPLEMVSLVLTKPSPKYFPSLSSKQEDYPVVLPVPAISVAQMINKKGTDQIELYADVAFTVLSAGQLATAKNGLQFVWRAAQTLIQATSVYLKTEAGQQTLLSLFKGDIVKRDEFLKKFGFLETAVTMGMVGEGIYNLFRDLRGSVYAMEQAGVQGAEETKALAQLENTIDEFENGLPPHLKKPELLPNLGTLSRVRSWLKSFGSSGCGRWFTEMVNSSKIRIKDLGDRVEYYFKSAKYGDGDDIKLATVTEEGGGFKVTKENNGVPDNFDPSDIEASTDDVAGLSTNPDGAAVVCADGTCDIKTGGCFVAGTLVQTPSGKKAIETLKKGDEVITYDSAAKINVAKRIVATTKKAMAFLRRIVIGKDTVTVTPGHLLFTKKGWLAASLITGGTLIANGGKTFTKVDTAFTVESPQSIYNFEVEGNHNYYVGQTGLLVHNGIDCNAKSAAAQQKRREVLAGYAKNYKYKVVLSWEEAQAAVEELLNQKIAKIKQLYPDAKIGYRGSLATGIKYKSREPFSPRDWDVDAFIISDNAYSKFPQSVDWKNIRLINDGNERSVFGGLTNDIEGALSKFTGYRLELKKPFTFRVWASSDLSKLKRDGCKILIE